VLPNGITYSSNSNSSFLGSVTYGLVQNGTTNLVPIIATNQSDAAITLTFATPVALFGTGFNYGVLDGEPFGSTMPFISAFDVFGGLIASYNLHELAPIFTPGGVDQFRFRGIDGGGIGIKSFTLSGAGIAAAGNVTTQGAVPEPGSWAMLIAGFGLVGATMRRRRALLA